MAFIQNDSYLLEEERKKKRLQGSLGIGGAVSISAPAPKPTASPVAPAVKPTSDVSDMSRDFFNQQAGLANKIIHEDTGTPPSAITDYFKMAKAYGSTQQADDRIKRVGFLWNSYMPGMDGSKAVWDLARSPYTTETIQSMLASGRSALFGAKAPNRLIPAKDVEALGLDPSNPDDVLKASLHYSIGGGSGLGATRDVNLPVMTRGARASASARVQAAKPDTSKVPEKPGVDWWITYAPEHFLGLDAPDAAGQALLAQLPNVHLSYNSYFRDAKPAIQAYVESQYHDDPNTLFEGNNADYTQTETYKNATPDERSWMFAAHVIGVSRWRAANPAKYKQQQSAVTGEALGATMLMASGGASGILAKVALAAGGLGGLRESTGAAATARQKAETGAAAALADPLHMTSHDAIIKDAYGNQFPGKVTGADEAQGMLSYVQTLPEGDSKAVQESIQSDVYDTTGNIVRFGRGKGLKITGVWDGDWNSALNDWYGDEKYQNVLDIGKLIELGALPATHTNDGNMDDPAVATAIGKLQKSLAEQDAATMDPSVGGKMRESTGLPFTTNSLSMWWNQLTSNGLLQGIFRLPIEAAGAAGGGWIGMWAALNYEARASNDAALQAKKTALEQYVGGKGGKLDGTLVAAERMMSAGDFSNDMEAQRLYADYKQRQAQLLNEGWGDDVIGTVKNFLHQDPDKIQEWAKQHPNYVFAANLGRDLALSVAGARLPVFGTKAAIAPEAFASSDAALAATRNVANHIVRDDLRAAVKTIGGRDATKLGTEVENTYLGKWTQSVGLNDLAEQVRSGLENGNRDIVAQVTKVSPEQAISLTQTIERRLADMEAKPARAEVSELGTQGPRDMPAAVKVVEQRKVIAQALGKEQAANKSVIDVHEYAQQASAKAYATEAVYPYFRMRGMPTPSQTKLRIEQTVASTQDPVAQWFFGKTWKFFEKAPLSELDFNAPMASDRIFDAGMAASNGDVGYAIDLASRFARANSPLAYEKIGKNLETRANAEFNLSKSFVGEERPTALNVNPLTGEKVSEGAVMQTSRMTYKMYFKDVRDTMQSPYNTEQMAGIDKAITSTLNVGRASRKVLSARVTDPLRRINIISPNLTVKHFFSDWAFRRVIGNGPDAAFRPGKYSKGFETIVGEVSPDTAADMLLSAHKFKIGEQLYNTGKGSIDPEFQPKAVYMENPKTGRLEPTNMAKGVEDLRRWLIDKSFQAYAAGGEDGIRKWLYTKEGRKFLGASDNIKITKDTLNQGFDLTGGPLYDLAVEDYMARVVGEEFGPMANNFPGIFQGMKDVFAGTRTMSDKSIQAIIEDTNKGGVVENPFLSIGENEHVNMANPVNWVGKIMYPNKLAREQYYKAAFVKTYNKLKKSGIEADPAARISTDVAEIKTTRDMFDLANATYAESQNRWFAFFATKHRLYSTWLGKMAIERPWVAGAATDVKDWMEERNKRPGVPEWNKFKLVLDLPFEIPGVGPFGPWKQATWDLAGTYWLSDYPLESTPGKASEWALSTIGNMLPGVPNTTINWGNFSPSFSRYDRVIQNTAAVLPLVDLWAKGKLDQDAIKNFLDNLPAQKFGGGVAQQQQWSKAINLQLAHAEMAGKPLSVVDATKKAIWSSILYEGIQGVKPLPLQLTRTDDLKIEKTKEQFYKLDPSDRSNWLKDPANSWFSSALGLKSTNPATRVAVDQGWADYADIYKRWAIALQNMVGDGSINNPDLFNSTMNAYEMEVSSLVDPNFKDPNTGDNSRFNKEFAKVFTTSGMADFMKEDAFKIVVPLIDPKVIVQQGYKPTTEQVAEFRRTATEQYQEYAKKLGMLPNDLNDPAVFWTKQALVEDRVNEYAKIDPSDWMTYRQQTAMDIMAQGDVGATTLSKYVTEVHNQYATKLLGRGIDGSAKAGYDASTPVFGLMTMQDKKNIGWNSTPDVEDKWKEWAKAKYVADQYISDQGASSQSKLAVRVRQHLQDYGTELADGSTDFKKEWDFSHLALDARLKQLGVGQDNSSVAEGWNAFFGVVADYKHELANTINPSTKKLGVGPASQTAAPIQRKYLQTLVGKKLKDRYPEWWTQFDGLFPLSSFGFYSAWTLPDGSDSDYWWANKGTETPETQATNAVMAAQGVE